MHVAIRGGLGQYTTESEVGGIRLYDKGKLKLEMLEHWRRHEGPLQHAKGCICCRELSVNLTPFWVRDMRGEVREE